MDALLRAKHEKLQVQMGEGDRRRFVQSKPSLLHATWPFLVTEASNPSNQWNKRRRDAEDRNEKDAVGNSCTGHTPMDTLQNLTSQSRLLIAPDGGSIRNSASCPNGSSKGLDRATNEGKLLHRSNNKMTA